MCTQRTSNSITAKNFINKIRKCTISPLLTTSSWVESDEAIEIEFLPYGRTPDILLQWDGNYFCRVVDIPQKTLITCLIDSTFKGMIVAVVDGVIKRRTLIGFEDTELTAKIEPHYFVDEEDRCTRFDGCGWYDIQIVNDLNGYLKYRLKGCQEVSEKEYKYYRSVAGYGRSFTGGNYNNRQAQSRLVSERYIRELFNNDPRLEEPKLAFFIGNTGNPVETKTVGEYIRFYISRRCKQTRDQWIKAGRKKR